MLTELAAGDEIHPPALSFLSFSLCRALRFVLRGVAPEGGVLRAREGESKSPSLSVKTLARKSRHAHGRAVV